MAALTGHSVASTYLNLLQKGSGTNIEDGAGAVWTDLSQYATKSAVSGSTVLSASYSLNSSLADQATNWDSSSVISLIGTKQALLITGSTYPITSSWSIWATYWDSSSVVSLINTKQNVLITGSTYPFTSSWATSAINWDSSSVVSLINTKQNALVTGSTYPFTSSWASQAVSWNSSSVVSLINTKQNTLITGSTYPFTSSWAINVGTGSNNYLTKWSDGKLVSSLIYDIGSSIGVDKADPSTYKFIVNGQIFSSGSTAGLYFSDRTGTAIWGWYNTGSTARLFNGSSNIVTIDTLGNITASFFQGTASYANRALSASYAPYTDTVLASGSSYNITSSWAVNVGTGSNNYITKWANNRLASSLIYDNGSSVGVDKSDPSTYKFIVNGQFFSSGSLSGLYFNDRTGTTMWSWYSTGSAVKLYNGSSNVVSIDTNGNITSSGFQGTASYANQALSASYAPGTGGSGTTLTTGSTYPITASWANNLIGSITSASYASTASKLSPPGTSIIVAPGGGTGITTNAVLIGSFVAESVTNVANSVFIGYSAGEYAQTSSYSTFLGFNAGWNAYTSSYCTFVGADAGVASSNNAVSKSSAFGWNAKVSQSNTIVLGDTGSNGPRIAIGTNTPKRKVHVEGDVLINNGYLYLKSNLGNYWKIGLYEDAEGVGTLESIGPTSSLL